MNREYNSQGVEFLSVVLETAQPGEAADVEYAEYYADHFDIDFPCVPDFGGNFAPFMGDGYPSNVIFDLRTMERKYRNSGMLTSSEISAKLDALLE